MEGKTIPTHGTGLHDLVDKMDNLINTVVGPYNEAHHEEADEILLEALELLGGQKVVDAYQRLEKLIGGFWHA
jgi:hypothetical protein